ncbi:hypothetical protein EDB92DRAFT_1838135 [Lactarius akahatsu]|uniref:Uncharacterized protein n=1 Tax=Lactarius akahatsu TaxID=416441 RepID=A0AAD4QGT3_9AGAM|nr:hypothetical protein EDB92DRAFT_1838135 [Lactarius akahatsu]
MPKTEGSVWSFDLRSYNPNDLSDSDSDDALPDNLCSDGSTLVDQPLSEDNDTAVFKPNPWSIAKINAASRLASHSAQKSQESYDVRKISEINKAYEKKQPKGRIVDLLKKQAQQPSAGKISGLRPLDAPLSGNTRKPGYPSKSSTLSDSFPAVLGNRHHLGKCDYTKAVDSTRRLRNAPCDTDPLSTGRRAIHTKTAFSSNARAESRLSISGNCATQSSGASRSGSLFQSGQESSTWASIGQSPLGPCIVASEHSPGALPRAVIPPQHQALPASDPPYRGPDVSSSLINQISTSFHDDSGAPLRTCLPLEFQTQKATTPALANANESPTHLSSQNRVSIKKATKPSMTPSTALTSWTSPASSTHLTSTPFAPPHASTYMYAQEPSVIDIPSISHNIVDEQNAFPIKNRQGAQTKLSEAHAPQPQEGVLPNVESRPRSQSAVAVPASQSKPDFPVLTHRPVSSAPALECLPAMSRTRLETDKPPRFTSVHKRGPTTSLPAPGAEIVGASCLSLPHAGESAYNHPALRSSVDDDAEWSTLPKRNHRPPSAQSKSLITSSAKFLLPTRTRAPSPTESHEVEAGKRPRITLYHPPPRTAAIDLAGLEGRYACVRSAMRKVRTPDILHLGSCLGRSVHGGRPG